MTIEHSIEIHRPIEEVFDLLTNPTRLLEWQVSTVAVRRERTGALTIGEQFTEVHAAFGRELESTVEIAAYDRPRTFEIRVLDGAVPLDGRWTLAPVGHGTHLTFEGSGTLRGPMRLIGPLLARVLNRRFLGYHRRLKRLMESGPTTA
jgi:uncharacterized protein YndB with AHSA1/START domain